MSEPVLFYGFGEAGRAFAAGLRPPAGRAYDIAPGPGMERAAVDCGVGFLPDRGEALAGVRLAFCLVTADQALAAAEAAVAAGIEKGMFWLDGNSCSPGTKTRAAAVIEAAGGRYVDTAVMAPVHPGLHRTPLLLSGPHAADAAAILTGWDMRVALAGDRVGAASMRKMLRSIIVKGREALAAECLLAARRAGVDGDVIAAIQATEQGDFRTRSAYDLERMMVHGTRRAAEMREVAATLRELGLPDAMASATAEWQARIGALGLPGGAEDLAGRADRILGRLP